MKKNVHEGISKIKNTFLRQTLPAENSMDHEIPTIIVPAPPENRVKFYPRQLIVGSAQSIGLVRDHNEDALFTLCSTISFADSQLPLGIFIIADGMGGHLHGEIASSVAVRSSSEILTNILFSQLIGLQAKPQEENLQDILVNCILEVNRQVIRKAPGGGTTLTIAILIGNQITIAHIGDSRAYIISPDNQCSVITRDHSLVNRLVEVGEITQEEAAVHPQRNVLIRAIGQVEPVIPDIFTTPFSEGSHLLLCSDGLWGVISKDELVKIITTTPNPSLACHKLVKAVYKEGAPDNISIILAQFLD